MLCCGGGAKRGIGPDSGDAGSLCSFQDLADFLKYSFNFYIPLGNLQRFFKNNFVFFNLLFFKIILTN